MGNCFRVRGVVSNSLDELLQFEATGTLFDVLYYVVHYTNEFSRQIQVLIIEQLANEKACVEDAVYRETSRLIQEGTDFDQLAEIQSELENRYYALFTGEYKPPKVEIEGGNGRARRIVIEGSGER